MQARSFALITNARDASWAADAQQRGALGDVRLIALTLRGRLAARAARLQVDSADWLAGRLDRNTLRMDARFYARFWSEFNEIRELSVVDTLAGWRGYPLLVMQSAHLSYWLTEALSAACVAQLLIEAYKPDAVWLPPATDPPASYWCSPSVNMDADALAGLCERRGVAVHRMPHANATDRSSSTHLIRDAIQRVWSSLQGWHADAPTEMPSATPMYSVTRRGGRGSVLAVSHAYHYAQQIAPYLIDLRRSGFDVACGLHEAISDDIQTQLENAGVACIALPPLVESARAACDLTETATAAFQQVDAAMQEGSLLRDRTGDSFWPLVRSRFQRLFVEDIPTTAAHLMTAERLVDDLSPDVLLTGLSESGIDAAFPLAARRANCPSVGFQHGLILNGNAPFVSPATDKFALWGKSTQRQLPHLHDASPVVGHAAYAEPASDAPKASRVAERLGLDPARPICLFLGAMGWATNDVDRYAEMQILSAVLDLEHAIPGLQLILRLHAGEDVTAMQALAELHDSTAILQPDAALADLLNACDVVVTQTTTGGLEALLADRPIVYLNICSDRDWLPYATAGAAAGVYAPDDLAPAVRTALNATDAKSEANEAARQQFIADAVACTGVMAADAMTQLCASAIEGRRMRPVTDLPGRTDSFADYLQRSRAFADASNPTWAPPLPTPEIRTRTTANEEVYA